MKNLLVLSLCWMSCPVWAMCEETTELGGPEEALALARFAAASAALNAGNLVGGREALAHLVNDLPYTEGARRAFVLARGVYRDSGGAGAEAEFLLQVASRLAWVAEPGARKGSTRARALLAEALVEVGRIRLEECGLAEASARMLSRAVPVARNTPWEDDALIWMARALREQGRYAESLTVYDELIRGQQAAWLFGVHVSPYYDHALYEAGQILESQQRLEEAQATYSELFRRTPRSGLLESAAARLQRLRAHLHTAWETGAAVHHGGKTIHDATSH